jgi:hypothetical protein
MCEMNMFINEHVHQWTDFDEHVNMFINEPFLVKRRPTLNILDRACQASSRAGKPELPFN